MFQNFKIKADLKAGRGPFYRCVAWFDALIVYTLIELICLGVRRSSLSDRLEIYRFRICAPNRLDCRFWFFRPCCFSAEGCCFRLWILRWLSGLSFLFLAGSLLYLFFAVGSLFSCCFLFLLFFWICRFYSPSLIDFHFRIFAFRFLPAVLRFWTYFPSVDKLCFLSFKM